MIDLNQLINNPKDMHLFIKDLKEQTDKLKDLTKSNSLIVGADYTNEQLAQPVESLKDLTK